MEEVLALLLSEVEASRRELRELRASVPRAEERARGLTLHAARYYYNGPKSEGGDGRYEVAVYPASVDPDEYPHDMFDRWNVHDAKAILGRTPKHGEVLAIRLRGEIVGTRKAAKQ